jgi:hypothetical protein
VSLSRVPCGKAWFTLIIKVSDGKSRASVPTPPPSRLPRAGSPSRLPEPPPRLRWPRRSIFDALTLTLTPRTATAGSVSSRRVVDDGARGRKRCEPRHPSPPFARASPPPTPARQERPACSACTSCPLLIAPPPHASSPTRGVSASGHPFPLQLLIGRTRRYAERERVTPGWPSSAA